VIGLSTSIRNPIDAARKPMMVFAMPVDADGPVGHAILQADRTTAPISVPPIGLRRETEKVK